VTITKIGIEIFMSSLIESKLKEIKREKKHDFTIMKEPCPKVQLSHYQLSRINEQIHTHIPTSLRN
jgi:hypothetical protein